MRNQKITKFEKTKKFTTYKIIIRLKFEREGPGGYICCISVMNHVFYIALPISYACFGR